MAKLFDMLKEDHNNVKQMLDQTIKNKDTSKYSQIKKELEIHMNGEEKFLYPKLMEQDKEHALESYEEHHVGKLILNELDETSQNDEAWMPKIKVLKDVIEHHIEEEENEIFPEAQDMLSNEEEQQITQQFEEFKSQNM